MCALLQTESAISAGTGGCLESNLRPSEREKKTTVQIHSNRSKKRVWTGTMTGTRTRTHVQVDAAPGGREKGVTHIDALAYLDAS